MKSKVIRQVEIAKANPANGLLPGGAELKELLGLKHGVVGEEIWHAALMESVQDLTTRPAKQIRGQVVRLAYRLTSGAGRCSLAARERCDILANVAELIHAGSLIVDDIQDGSTMRRGAPALHIRYGVPLALNSGNWLYFWPFELIKKAGLSKQREILAYERCQRMLLRAHFGQALDVGADIENINQEKVPGVCLASMELKSGALMGFALLLGGLVADVPERGLSVLDEFGHDLGVALQMFDEEWWQALADRLETRPQSVPEPLRRLSHPQGGDTVSVSLAEARAIQAWAATLPGWAGGPRHAPYPLRVERAA